MTDTQTNSLSPARAASHPDMVTALTASARNHASTHDLLDVLASLRLADSCTIGDMVSLLHEGVRHDFSIIRRRRIAGAGTLQLEISLDHPARTAVRPR